MFSKKDRSWTGTLSFRLTVWYAVVFTLTSFFALSFFYYRISDVTMENTDDELREEVHELSLFMASEGADQVVHQIEAEAAEEDKNVFFRLLSPEGGTLEKFNMDSFESIGVSRQAISALNAGKAYTIETVDNPLYKYDVRTIYGALSPQLIFNMGISLEDNYEFLSVFRNLIFMLMIPLSLLATGIGWLLARHALKGVQEVTRTAGEISKGSIHKRVQVKKRSYEIDELAKTFNEMLDRIEDLIKSIREMNDNIAHDLRSPLTRIRGIAEMTLVGNATAESYREMAINTVEECDKLIEIINTMLDITEAEAGVNSIETQQIDLIGVILSACELFEPIAEEKDVQLFTVLPEQLMIDTNRNRLQRLVTNLLENAIKYNRQGGTVTISAGKNGKESIYIKVEDTGTGIPEADLPKIFERFYRSDRGRTEPGVGLGLSLAQSIAKAFGGNIHVSSLINKGSTFYVTLPV